MAVHISKNIFGGFFLLISLSLSAQFAPPAGMPGTTAMYKDSTAFTAWAAQCEVVRGFVNISDTNFIYWVNTTTGSNRAYYGIPEYATGKADDSTVVSLGDGGIATLTFPGTIFNGPGPDFAVFENALTDTFLELAFVEVSSDGINYFRFPCTSLTNPNVQVPSFGSVDATKIDNLAGKYHSGFGTPFDLDTLRNTEGLDIDKISHIRVIDAVGCIQPQYATYDALGNPVNDLWPTPFNTSGFDLDAVGAVYFIPQGIEGNDKADLISVNPNPASDYFTINLPSAENFDVTVFSAGGIKILEKQNLHSGTKVNTMALVPGYYMVVIKLNNGTTVTKKISIR